MVKQLEREGGEGRYTGEARGGRREKHDHKNWRQVSERELTRRGLVSRSRYQAVSTVWVSVKNYNYCCFYSMSRFPRQYWRSSRNL